MRALVTVASRHGATAEIGEFIALTLRETHISVDTIQPEDVADISDYDGVIIGSAIYLGRWLAPACDFVETHADELRRVPVWLFGSGPITDVKDASDVAEGKRLQELVAARDNRLFAGQLKKDGLNIFERVSVSMVGSPWGDHRPWPEIKEWAESISLALNKQAVPA